MKAYLMSALLLFGASALSGAEPGGDVYRVALRAPQVNMQMFVCINEECQKSLGHQKVQDEYVYDFGTFPLPKSENFTLRVWRYYPEQRRIRLSLE